MGELEELRSVSDQDRILDQIHSRLARGPVDAGGNGPQNPGMEARIAVLEANLAHIRDDVRDIKSDIRLVLSAIGVSFVLLAGGLATAYIQLSSQMQDVAQAVGGVSERVAHMEGPAPKR